MKTTNIPIMPQEYKGTIQKKSEYTTTQPRQWTDKEIEWAKNLNKMGYNSEEISRSLGRSQVSVEIKLKRITKKEDSYNNKHIEEKYAINRAFIETIRPKSVLDLFAGEKSYYKTNYPQLIIVTNEKNKDIEADYHEEAFKLICKLYARGGRYDIIDLDPFGSAFDCFDIAIKMAKKGLIVTLGEMGHKRFNRLDFVGTRYGIKSVEDFTIDRIIDSIKLIGKRNKKTLTPLYVKEWRNIGRVWFAIDGEYKNPVKPKSTKVTEEEGQLSIFDFLG